ncbi:putative secreted protein with PEP-CTERM sorting signal [Nitrosospira sp. Nsp2]|uniref:HAF repeat-containing PEP-CTERM protein n=1 Tax=Nitrosospira sp. Nsp2 TaxID=136548 RepID=UPI000D30610F|nr:HAF repeat-containing PEP-CTERM protein [Nitrosospira sp. Nsp2]PTR16061.1 putative secreted protein with PEP-CTERM sorting signal [Nitrosospira sp. Nsp2]
MKIIRAFKVRGFILAAAFSAGLGFATSASAQARHSYLVDLNSKTVTDIGTLGGLSSYAIGVNDGGQVVGSSDTAGGTHAFITGPDGIGMRDLGTLGGTSSDAFGINDAGQVVGYSYLGGGMASGGAYHAFITGPDGMGMRDLGTLGGSISSHAFGINDTGQVVGSSMSLTDQGGYNQHAFITSPNGMGMRDLGIVAGSYNEARGINDAGQAVGFYYGNTGAFSVHAFMTGPNGMGMRELDTLGGDASASGINDAGQVVGSAGGSVFSDQPSHAFITGPAGESMRDLGTLGGPGSYYDYSYASGINDAGQVVGTSSIGATCFACELRPISHAFITGPNGAGMMDLNSLVDLPGGVVLSSAAGINNMGQVIAIGIVPEPEVYALFLAGLALVGFIARRKKISADAFSVR